MSSHRAANETLLNCPLCQSVELSELQATTDFASFTTSGQEIVFPIGVSGCRHCGFILLNPRATQGEMAHYYGLQARKPRSFVSLDKPYSDLLDHQTGFIRKVWTPRGRQRLLDVGCAEGFFLKRLAAECPDGVDLEGVEPGSIYAAAARSLLPDARIHEVILEECRLDNDAFDIITLRHVLEHLLHPVGALALMRPLLKPTGLLHIEVPDVTNWPATLSPLFHHEHMNYFTPPTMRVALERSGYRVVAFEAAQDNPVGSGFSYPIMRVLAASAGEPMGTQAVKGDDAERIYRGYVERQRDFVGERVEAIERRVKQLAAADRRIGVFGAGPHTMDLFHAAKIEHLLSVAFDNNPHKTGKRIRNIEIRLPDRESLAAIDAVVISSSEYERAMIDQVKSFNLPALEILALYSAG